MLKEAAPIHPTIARHWENSVALRLEHRYRAAAVHGPLNVRLERHLIQPVRSWAVRGCVKVSMEDSLPAVLSSCVRVVKRDLAGLADLGTMVVGEESKLLPESGPAMSVLCAWLMDRKDRPWVRMQSVVSLPRSSSVVRLMVALVCRGVLVQLDRLRWALVKPLSVSVVLLHGRVVNVSMLVAFVHRLQILVVEVGLSWERVIMQNFVVR